MALLAFVTGYVQRVYPARAPVCDPWPWFAAFLVLLAGACVALVCLPFWVWQDWNRYDPPPELTRAARRRKMRT
jgi:hypothetical protein